MRPGDHGPYNLEGPASAVLADPEAMAEGEHWKLVECAQSRDQKILAFIVQKMGGHGLTQIVTIKLDREGDVQIGWKWAEPLYVEAIKDGTTFHTLKGSHTVHMTLNHPKDCQLAIHNQWQEIRDRYADT